MSRRQRPPTGSKVRPGLGRALIQPARSLRRPPTRVWAKPGFTVCGKRESNYFRGITEMQTQSNLPQFTKRRAFLKQAGLASISLMAAGLSAHRAVADPDPAADAKAP